MRAHAKKGPRAAIASTIVAAAALVLVVHDSVKLFRKSELNGLVNWCHWEWDLGLLVVGAAIDLHRSSAVRLLTAVGRKQTCLLQEACLTKPCLLTQARWD